MKFILLTLLTLTAAIPHPMEGSSSTSPPTSDETLFTQMCSLASENVSISISITNSADTTSSRVRTAKYMFLYCAYQSKFSGNNNVKKAYTDAANVVKAYLKRHDGDYREEGTPWYVADVSWGGEKVALLQYDKMMKHAKTLSKGRWRYI